MKITYQFKEEAYKKACRNYYEQTIEGKTMIDIIFWMLWWMFIYFFLILSILSAHDHGAFVGIVVYTLCNIAFAVCKGVVLDQSIKDYVRKAKKRAEETTVTLTRENISWRTITREYFLNWPAIKKVERLPDCIWFNATTQNILVPRYAFASDQEFDEFYKLAKQYQQASQEQGVAEDSEKKTMGKVGRILIGTIPFLFGLIVLLLAMYVGVGNR